MNKTVMREAPDISAHNGIVNFKAIRDAGYSQVILRAGYGKNNVDQRYISNAEACRNLGIPVMTYWFSYALNDAMSGMEAEYAVVQTNKYWQACPIAYDLEYDTVRYAATKGIKIDKTLATDMAVAFLKKVKECGYIPVLYFNRDYKQNYFDLDRIKREVGDNVQMWYALYSSTIPLKELEGADIWQYTSKGSISGVFDNVDINKIYVDIFTGVRAVQQKQMCNLYILGFQQAANADRYVDDRGSRLVEDGLDGKCTQAVRKKVCLKLGSTGALVVWWQIRLNEVLGEQLTVDGKFGIVTRAATRKFQKQFTLQCDGIAGYNTIQMAFYH